jgi:hypothetical protein
MEYYQFDVLMTHPEIYSPGIGVCNIACIPQKELQNFTRGLGIQDLNVETSITRKAFFAAIKSQKISVSDQ